MIKFYTPIYALTLLLSAFLLFSVQPMFSKMILPLLGGTPQVWNTAMLFFQTCLLGGYAYAHGTSRYLGVRTQGILHITLLLLFSFTLPFIISDSAHPPTDSDPTLWQLSLMGMMVGGPFFVMAASAPMLQNWFSHSNHPDANNPYFLYGASNLGSMTALLSYPVLIEPLLALNQQAHIWMYGYFLLIVFIALSCAFIWKYTRFQAPIRADLMPSTITNMLRLRWIILAAIPSSLMLGVTTYITTDIASVPMLWIIPLAIYIGTFIIVFARKLPFKTDYIFLLSGIVLLVLTIVMVVFNLTYNPIILIAIHMNLFFLLALSCHLDLANSRPNAQNLTEFFLFMSLGGVIGGFFNAIIVPNFFIIPMEYQLVLVLAGLTTFSASESQKIKGFLKSPFSQVYSNFFSARSFFTILISIVFIWIIASILVIIFTSKQSSTGPQIVYNDRNFFGVIRIKQTDNLTTLLHGTTVHGTQSRDEKYRLKPLAYYSSLSPLADAFAILDELPQNDQNIAAIGLGVGSVSCYKHEGRSFDFYEIDKDIVDIAENKKYFTFLSDCGSSYQIIMGDGRLKIAQKPDYIYDAIILDAFSSDNIPVHLLTREAIELYLQKLKPNGLLLIHISNNYMNLEPVIANIAADIKIPALAKISAAQKLKDSGITVFKSHYVALSKNESFFKKLEDAGWLNATANPQSRVWTDQYSNIFSVLGNKSVDVRLNKQYKDQLEKAKVEAETKKGP